jgi:hypothetical protein
MQNCQHRTQFRSTSRITVLNTESQYVVSCRRDAEITSGMSSYRSTPMQSQGTHTRWHHRSSKHARCSTLTHRLRSGKIFTWEIHYGKFRVDAIIRLLGPPSCHVSLSLATGNTYSKRHVGLRLLIRTLKKYDYCPTPSDYDLTRVKFGAIKYHMFM